MSTHASIAVVLPNGGVRAGYLHFDGYLEGAGLKIFMHFNSFEGAKKLVGPGELRSIDTNGVLTPFEDATESKYYTDLAEYFGRVRMDFGSEYQYLYFGQWQVWTRRSDEIKYLATALMEEGV